MISSRRALSLILTGTSILSISLGLLLMVEIVREQSPIWMALTAGVLVCFTVFTAGLGWWIASSERQAQDLTVRAGASLATVESSPIPMRGYAGAVAQLARLLEQWRRIVIDQRRTIASLELVRGRILDGIGEGILAVDPEKNIVFTNRKLLDLIDAPQPEGRTPFYQWIRHAAIHSAIDRALEGHSASEIVSMSTGGSERQVKVHVFPLEHESGIAAVAILIDVTRVEKLERIRRDFLSDFSHEVRTPLAGLRTAVETLEAGGLDADQQEQLWGIANRQLTRLERLVHDLSELNRIESGELQLFVQEVDLNDLLRDLAKDFADRAASRQVSLVVNAGGPVEVFVDPQRVQQIVGNLIDNAIKFSPRGGQVTLRAFGADERIVIEVSDQGEGIPEGERRRIFNRFYRVDRSRSQEVPGTGLGLAITKHLTALQGGSIEVDSEPGRGSTFRVTLPATDSD
jgi:two-component system, OmpR family, phosphate regulon sensor histidine kinase PhoR